MTPACSRRALAAILAFLLWAGGTRARAETSGEGIGVYGRFDHDLALSAGAGGGARIGPGPARALATVEARALYLHTAGIVVAGTFTPGAERPASGSVAVELRPLFLVSLFENRFSGDPFADLALYEVGLEAGLAWDTRRPAFLVGLGTELPLVRRRDRGLFLRLGVRLTSWRTRWVLGQDAGLGVEIALALQAHGGVSAGLL